MKITLDLTQKEIEYLRNSISDLVANSLLDAKAKERKLYKNAWPDLPFIRSRRKIKK